MFNAPFPSWFKSIFIYISSFLLMFYILRTAIHIINAKYVIYLHEPLPSVTVRHGMMLTAQTDLTIGTIVIMSSVISHADGIPVMYFSFSSAYAASAVP